MRFTWQQHDTILIDDNALWWADPVALDQDMIAEFTIARVEIDSCSQENKWSEEVTLNLPIVAFVGE